MAISSGRQKGVTWLQRVALPCTDPRHVCRTGAITCGAHIDEARVVVGHLQLDGGVQIPLLDRLPHLRRQPCHWQQPRQEDQDADDRCADGCDQHRSGSRIFRPSYEWMLIACTIALLLATLLITLVRPALKSEATSSQPAP